MEKEREKYGLPGSLKRAMEDDSNDRTVTCPICNGTGKVDGNKSPVIKAAWDALTNDTIKAAVHSVVTEALQKMPDPPEALHRQFRLSEDAMLGQRRFKNFQEAAAVLRKLSGMESAAYILRETLETSDALLVDVLFRRKVDADDGVRIFNTQLEQIEADEYGEARDQANDGGGE